jgi:uncharacterized tellurite resistance protein B-like protein
MIFPEEKNIVVEQKRKKEKAVRDLFAFLDAMEDFVLHLFPEVQPEQTVKQRFLKVKQWVKQVYDLALLTYNAENIDELIQIDPLDLPQNVSSRIIGDLLKVFSCRFHLSENEVLFLSEVGNAVSLPPEDVDANIEKSMYQMRKEFTELIKKFLNEDQRYWVALMLWKAVHADHKIHPKEYKYFENIAQILSYNLKRLTQLENEPDQFRGLPLPELDPRFYRHIFRYIVEIVMIDGQFDPDESQFVQEMGRNFGYDKKQQDLVIQPVASALMLRQNLFG